MEKLYVDVVLELSNTKIDKLYTYKVPQELKDDIYIGCPIQVKFGSIKKAVNAYVISIKTEHNFSEDKIKDIYKIRNNDLSANKNLLKLAVYIKKQYACTFAKAISTVMPVKTRLKRKLKIDNPFLKVEKDKDKDKKLNFAQTLAYNKFLRYYDSGINKTYLLHGITGSGKSLLYVNMIKRVLKDSKQVIVLIPEISLTYQSISLFISIFGDRVAILNSRMSKGERVEQFEKVLAKEVDIMIGPRSALFTPFDNLGLIIIDEEHDNAYKNENTPRYDTRDLANELTKINNASLVLVSATPSPETYKKAVDKEYELLELKERAVKDAYLPEIHIVDLAKELEEGNRSVFSRKLKELIEDRLEKKEQIMLFMNRRGVSNFISCRSCGEVMKCPHCDVSLTLHSNNKLYCHYCSYTMDMPKFCPKCSSFYLAGFGVGTQKLEVLTKKMFPSARVLRLDQDSSKKKGDSFEIIKKFSNKEADILIGTQMIVKGHDFKDVSLVGIVAADTSLYINDYTSSQRTYELITQAAGRAGRADKKGDVVIQTYNPRHYAIIASAENDYDLYYKNEMAFRKIAMYPPLVYILGIQLSSKSEIDLKEAVKIYVGLINKYSDKSFSIVGPVEPNVYKLKDYYRNIIYIKSVVYADLISLKNNIDLEIENFKIYDHISLIYDLV